MELLLGGALLWILSGFKSDPKKKDPPPPPPPPAPKASTKPGFVQPTIAGAGAALAGLTGELGAQLTQDEWGRLAGTLNSGLGTEFNVGRVVGKSIDIAAGGDGTGATGVIAQGFGGIITVLATAVGVLASVGAATFGIVAYAIGAGISDLSRLAYGQAGAQADYDKEWQATFTHFKDSLIDPGHGKTGIPAELAHAIAYQYTDGYMGEKNRSAFRQWMARGRGLLGLGTTDDTYHAVFGRDRGYFVGDVSGGRLVKEPAEKILGQPETWRNGDIDRIGRLQANIDSFLKWRAETPGFGVPRSVHIDAGRKAGFFTGTLTVSPSADEYSTFTMPWYQVKDGKVIYPSRWWSVVGPERDPA